MFSKHTAYLYGDILYTISAVHAVDTKLQLLGCNRCIAVLDARPIVTDGVAWSVCQSVRLSRMIVSAAKTAKPIEIPFAMWTRAGRSYHVLDGGADAPCEEATLRGEWAGQCKVKGHFAVRCAKMAAPNKMEMGC